MSEMVMIPNTPTLVAEENPEKVRVSEQQQAKDAAAAAAARLHRSSSMREEKKDRLPVQGEMFETDKGQQIVLKQKLGDGAMGHVFLTTLEGRPMAVKTEKHSTGMLPMEIKVLLSTQRDKCKHFCKIVDYGTVRREYNYMLISLLGRDLYRLRSEMPTRSFTINTTSRIALETLESIEELHGIGYLSRDVKPSNFAPGLREFGEHKTIFMFDFGLAKKYVDRDGRKLKSRGEVGWRGTVRYGSLNAHKRMDLGRRDDLECWFYMLVEMHVGELPWRFLTDRAAVGKAKCHVRDDGRHNFFIKLPMQFELILKMIDGYAFENRPDYKQMKKLINEIRAENKCSERQPWDWQTDESQLSELTETVSVMSDMAILAEQGATNVTDRNQG